MNLRYPTYPEGMAPSCFRCSNKTDLSTLCHTGYSKGNGAQSTVCRHCGATTFFDIITDVEFAEQVKLSQEIVNELISEEKVRR